MHCGVSVRFAFISNIDHRLRQPEEHAGSITVPHIAVDALEEAGETSPGAERTEAHKEAVLSL
jgi:hypothetical protein